MTQQVEKSCFSTQNLTPAQRLPVWRDSISTIFAVSPPANSVNESFNATLTSYLLNEQIMLSRCDTQAQRFERSPLRIAQDGIDHYMIQTHLSGHQQISRASKSTHGGSGDLLALDLADRQHAVTSEFSHLTLVIPRQLLAPRLINPDSQQGRVLKGNRGLTMMAVNHLRMLERAVSLMSAEEALTIIEPTLALMAAALNGSADSVPDGHEAINKSLLAQARLGIEQHLTQNISIDALCQQLGLSRASLYRLFEPYGGVRAYVQERRLRHCARALIAPENAQRRIYDVAYDLGFGSESHFSRAFRRRFGMTPRDARQLGLLHRSQRQLSRSAFGAHQVGDRDYEHWLSTILKL